MPKLSLIRTEHGKLGVLRTYQHSSLGRLMIVTMHGKADSADVIHVTDVKRVVSRQQLEPVTRRKVAP